MRNQKQRYEQRSEQQQRAITALASEDPDDLDEYGAITELSRGSGVELDALYKARNQYPAVIAWKRRQLDEEPTTPERADVEDTFRNRNAHIRDTIDTLAARSERELDQHGAISQLAREEDIDYQRAIYVRDQWGDLIEWRRDSMTDPTDEQSVKNQYDDPTLADMVDLQADGAGNVRVPLELTLNETFRAIKLLPGDLGMKVFTQLLENSDELPRDMIRDIVESSE